MDPIIVVALITAFSVITGQVLNHKQSKHTRQTSQETLKIVQGNGRGDVVQMLRSVQDSQEIQGGQIESVLHWQGGHEAWHLRQESSL